MTNAITTIDPITMEVIQNGLGSIVDEMALTVMRTAYSGVVKDALDYSTAFCNAEGEVIAQGLTIVVHLGSFPSAVKSILQQFEGRIEPGDMFISNDPYTAGGIHLPDIYVIKPVFDDGTLQGFACVVAHHTDVGGLVPGSNSTQATEIYQEGLCLPAMKLYERGEPVESIFKIIERNVRVPDKVLGDLRAEIAAAHIGERSFLSLLRRYGAETFRDYCNALLDYSERLARAEIAALPDGEYEATGHIDGDSIESGPVTIKVKITISGEELNADFSGSSSQVKAGINSPIAFTRSAVYGAVRLILDPSAPNSAGYFRPITVTAPAGTVVHPVLPGACGARGITGFRIMDTVAHALAAVAPDRVPADGEGGNTILSMGGYDADFNPFVYVDLIAGARGGAPWADGAAGIPHPGSNIANTPIEIAEVELPIRIEAYGFAQDSGGAGKFRGAPGQIRQVRLLADEAILQMRSDKRRFLPYGLHGGLEGTPSMTILNPGTDDRELPTQGMTPIRKGDVVWHTLAGGGGWGDPADRDPEAVLADVRNELLSIEAAERFYGVIIQPGTLTIDQERTAAHRSS
ncbi:MAG: hydantoinase B/oxoprolinase family protein [Thermomicrobiales bacterium]|nr:hydantoinase B/oxoprolinase family protein [Thermomicrobiales bacterium]